MNYDIGNNNRGLVTPGVVPSPSTPAYYIGNNNKGVTQTSASKIYKLNGKLTLHKLNTIGGIDGKDYDTYIGNDGYFYVHNQNDKQGYYYRLTNESDIKTLQANKGVSTPLKTKNVDNLYYFDAATIAPDITNNKTSSTQTSGGSGGGYVPISNPNALTKDDLDDFANQLKAELEALNQKPEPKSAAEIARIHNIDYNLDNILADYNNTTNQYYDAAIAEQNQLRDTFNRDNAYYVNSLLQDYYDSYRNQAATAINKGNLAANMLATNLAANDTNSATDLGMLQSINQLDEARKAELLQNRVEAENYYNNLGKTLAGFSTDYYNSDINSYIGAIEKYSQMYSANRILARAQAEAAAQRYSGLANAAVSNANAAATRYNSNYYKKLYDYYNATGDANPALSVQNIINGQNSYTSGGGN